MHLDPCYPSHTGGLHLAGARIKALPLSPEQDWRPDLTAISSQLWDQLKLFVLGYPHNPSARVGDQEDLNRIMASGARYDVVIAHDNPYVDLALDGEPPSLLQAPNWRASGIEFFSLSKGWCLGGFRLGFAVGAAPVIAALRRTKAVIDFNQTLALQQGAIQALQRFPDWPRQPCDLSRATGSCGRDPYSTRLVGALSRDGDVSLVPLACRGSPSRLER